MSLAHKVGREKANRVCCPVPVMQRHLGVNSSEQCFKSVAKFAMPCQKGGAAVYMCGLMDFILFKPIGNAPSTMHNLSICVANEIIPLSRIDESWIPIQCSNRMSQAVSFLLGNSRYISADPVSKCHGKFLLLMLLRLVVSPTQYSCSIHLVPTGPCLREFV